jgi:hypothetical protein
LGWLKYLDDPAFPYFEYMYLKTIHYFLTQRWWILQGGVDEVALKEWILVLKILEVDKKARRDLFLLAQSGQVGRTHANKILWQVLSGPALDPLYVDLSNLVTHEVFKARRQFDRPPRQHRDLQWWWWTCYETPNKWDLKWSPGEVPSGPWYRREGDGGQPLPPPECWGLYYHR